MTMTKEFVRPALCVPAQCLPFPDSYPRFEVFSVEIWSARCKLQSGPDVLASVRETIAENAVEIIDRVFLVVKDGAGHLFRGFWDMGRWEPRLLPLIVSDKWTAMPDVVSGWGPEL